jgi:hypothetical protein
MLSVNRQTGLPACLACRHRSPNCAPTRGVLRSVQHTRKQCNVDVVAHRNGGLDHLATDFQQDSFPLLFPTDPT